MQQFVRSRGGDAAREVVELGHLLREVSELTRLRWSDQARSQGAAIELSIESDASVFVQSDPSELREILTNLIFNAVDAMRRGGRLTLAAGQDRGRAFLRVADTGIGMDPETRRRCCEPFFTTKGIEGTGLGLAVCWSVAKRLGGELQIDSQVDRGTTVTLWLSAVARPHLASNGCAPPMVGTGSRRILVIEDRHDVSQTLCNMLRQLDHQAVASNSGEQGLVHLENDTFDLVITDLGMPGIDGREVARRIKLHMPNMPVILLTGWADELQAMAECPHGVDLVLAKPVSLDQLRSAIGQLVPTPV